MIRQKIDKESLYPVFVNDIASSLLEYGEEDFFIVCAKKIKKLYPQLIKKLKKTFKVIPFLDGEKVKSYKYKILLENILLKKGISRDSIICVIGGGTISDLTGFVASTLMRGIRWMIVPTTLLSMVDSCIGGKTAINNEMGKNLIGTFHFPEKIFVYLNFLKTLKKREFLNGLFEIIKCGLIKDKKLFFQSISVNSYDEPALIELIKKAQQIKIEVVKKDPFEKKGFRTMLNFGHTIGHAIESFKSGKLLHGECVGLGMILESSLSNMIGFLEKDDMKIIKDSLKAKLSYLKGMKIDEGFLDYMVFDKKRKRKKIYFNPLKEIGAISEEMVEVDLKDLKKILKEF